MTDLLPRFDIEVILVDGTDLESWEEALSEPTKLVLLETPSNPSLDIVDMKAVAERAHKAGAKVIVDNVFATPILQRPMEFGADVVVYSATKHIDGQGRCMGGAVLCDEDFAERLNPYLRHTGPAIAPMNAWLLLKGLETLDMRVKAQSAGALAVATYLDSREDVSNLRYPGLSSHPQHALAMRQMSNIGGTLITLDIKGGQEAAFRFLDGLRIMRISNNLGDSKTLVTHPATTTHQRLTSEERTRMGIGPGTVRISIGLENSADLIEDIERALSAPS